MIAELSNSRPLLLVVAVVLSSTTALAQTARSTATTSTAMHEVGSPGLIGDPAYFVGNDSGFVLVDYSTMALYRANPSGVWTHTRTSRGSGPGEFREISGVAMDKGGAVWVADAGNARLTRLSPELRVLTETTTQQPIGWPAPGRGPNILALPTTVQHLALQLHASGAVVSRIPWTPYLSRVNPILRERFVIRASDSLTVVQFRWLDRRIGIGNDARIRFDAGDVKVEPEILAIALDRSGSTAYRVDPKAREFALSVAAQNGVLYVLRGSADERNHGAEIAKYDARTGVYLGSLKLQRRALRIAFSGSLLLAIAETDDGYRFFRVAY